MGRVMFGGGKVGMVVPSAGILASDLAVGSSVYLMENGVATEYLVVNQGKPSGSSLYDDSCDGTWLLRKDCICSEPWCVGDPQSYLACTLQSEYLNTTFFNLFDENTKDIIKQCKIPYVSDLTSGSVVSGASGLSVFCFLLSVLEVGLSSSRTDGACLEYFNGVSNNKRIAYLYGSVSYWWLRTLTSTRRQISIVSSDGSYSNKNCGSSIGVRPALILPSNALFDADTIILKGVA